MLLPIQWIACLILLASRNPRKTIHMAQYVYYRFHLLFPRKGFNSFVGVTPPFDSDASQLKCGMFVSPPSTSPRKSAMLSTSPKTPSRTEIARHQNADSGDDVYQLHVENPFPVRYNILEVTQRTSSSLRCVHRAMIARHTVIGCIVDTHFHWSGGLPCRHPAQCTFQVGQHKFRGSLHVLNYQSKAGSSSAVNSALSTLGDEGTAMLRGTGENIRERTAIAGIPPPHLWRWVKQGASQLFRGSRLETVRGDPASHSTHMRRV